MKRYGNLYERIISLDNLYLAELKARKGKKNRKEIIQFINNLNENILEIHKSLINTTYKTSNYSHFVIYEPKKRELSALPYKDRVVHHAILNYLEPILVKTFISQSYSCIKHRGIHKCLNDLTKYLKNKEETKYCLKLDIKKFYPSVNNEILKFLLRTKIKDGKLLNLLDEIINSIQGLPLGSYTSQWFGNFYLNKFDRWVKETKKIKYYLRYCDDIVILGNNKEELHNLRKEIQQYLQENLRLDLSNYQVFPIESRGIDFVGYVSYHTHIALRKTIKQNFKRMLNKYPNKRSIASYNGWLSHCNSINLQQKYLK